MKEAPGRTAEESARLQRTRRPVRSSRKDQSHALCSLSLPKPLDEALDAVFNLRLRIVAKQPARLRDIGKVCGTSPGCNGWRSIKRMAIQLFFKQRDQFVQFDGLRFSQIEDFVIALLVVNRGAHARDDVVDIGVVASRRAVAEDRDGAALAESASRIYESPDRDVAARRKP